MEKTIEMAMKTAMDKIIKLKVDDEEQNKFWEIVNIIRDYHIDIKKNIRYDNTIDNYIDIINNFIQIIDEKIKLNEDEIEKIKSKCISSYCYML